MRRAAVCALATAVAALSLTALAPARADGLAELGQELVTQYATPRASTAVELDGHLRLRGNDHYNLDLDRGLTPGGAPLFPVPLAGGQHLLGADTRLRTDLAIYPAGAGVALKLRVDVLDNLALGSTPEGRPASARAPSPSASPGQAPPAQAFLVERAHGEVLTPFGLLAAGRMGNGWGLGIAANDGDCEECDHGDAADRIAFVTPLVGHMWAVAWDFSATGPLTRSADGSRPIDLEPSDDVRTVTAAMSRWRTPMARARRRAAGRLTVEYGAYLSHRWQERDVPAHYLATAQPIAGPGALVLRGYRATAADLWLRLTFPRGRVEAEAVLATAEVDRPSLVPGIRAAQPAASRQIGAAVESELDGAGGAWQLGLDAGFASGDPAPGFGAFPSPGAAAPAPGELDGPQADLSRDFRVDNYRFHPDYRIDRILFAEIIGTVTDAIYLRPRGSVLLADIGHAQLRAGLAAIASWAVEAQSTPGGERFLGLELDPGLEYVTDSGFTAALEHALFLPGAAFDNRPEGLDARAAQLVRVRLGFWF